MDNHTLLEERRRRRRRRKTNKPASKQASMANGHCCFNYSKLISNVTYLAGMAADK